MVIKLENSNIPFNPYIILIGGIIGVSTGAFFARLADAPALVTAAYRVGLAALILIPLAVWKAGDELRRLSLRDLKLAALSGIFLALHFAAWISSLDYTAVANSVVLLTPLIAKDQIQKLTVISIVLSVSRAWRFVTAAPHLFYGWSCFFYNCRLPVTALRRTRRFGLWP